MERIDEVKEEDVAIKENNISTSYGKVHYRSAGDASSPLFLIIHGSGTMSNSTDYDFLLWDYLIRYRQKWPLYMVSIDCPGYGLSTGLRSTIRGFPNLFISEVCLKLTGKSSCFILMGHSQGGQSIINAVYENNNLTKVVILDRAVCGDAKKMANLNIPNLLVWDIDDPGHPIKQGYQLEKIVKYNEFIKFKGSEYPYWHSDYMMDSIVRFMFKFKDILGGRNLPMLHVEEKVLNNIKILDKSPNVVIDKENKSRSVDCRNLGKDIKNDKTSIENNNKHVNSTSNNVQRGKPEENKNNNILIKTNYNSNARDSVEKELKHDKTRIEKNESKKSDSNSTNNIKTVKSEEDKNMNVKISTNTNLNARNSLDQEIKQDKTNLGKKDSKQVDSNSTNNIKTVKSDEDKNINVKINTNTNTNTNPNGTTNTNETVVKEKELVCPLCMNLFYEPISIKCGHNFCHLCIKIAFIYNLKCPLCRAEFTEEEVRKNIENPIINTKLTDLMNRNLSKEELERRKEQGIKELIEFESVPMIKIEYGNTSTKITSKKYSWVLFVKVISTPVKEPIDFIEFDINPGVKGSKPIVVKSSPYEMEKRTGFEFSCDIKIHFKKSVKLQTYTVSHRITLGHPKTSRFLIQKLNQSK